MNSRVFYLLSLLLITNVCVQAQNIFTYGKTAVSKEEFLRMYNKNAVNKKPEMTEKALNEYLQMYYKFKIKVAEAEAQKIDTVSNLASEINNYKKQLAKTYLTDKSEIDNLVAEAYQNSKKDVNVSHLLIAIPRGITDSVPTKKRIDSVYNLINSGKYTFEQAVQEFSTDKKNADLGYFTVFQVPYAMEKAAYTTAVGKISKPFLTSFGYHIIKKNSERPAKGEVQVAQILIASPKYKGEEGVTIAKNKADSIYTLLKKGSNFELMVKGTSDDKYTVNSEGVLPPFGIAMYPANYEEAAFGLKNIGDISQPIKTEYGFHILKLLKKPTAKSFEESKNELTKKVEKNERMEIARQMFTQKVKVKNNYKENTSALMSFIKSIPDSAIKNNSINFDLMPKSETVLIETNNSTYNVSDFVNFIKEQTRGRLYGGVEGGITSMFKTYGEKILNDSEEKNLEKENKEYAQLIKEYRDGTILYELISREVWNKATTDSTGLKQYYENNKTKYQWSPSFDGIIYKAMNKEDIDAFVDACKTMNVKDALTKVNGADGGVVKIAEEKNRFEFDKVEPQVRNQPANLIGAPLKNEDGQYVVYYIEKVYNEPTQKSLEDAKGYVIADFQDYIEKTWVNKLQEKYPLKVDAKTFSSLIGK